MRLLNLGKDDSIKFTDDLEPANIPPYAILSHTWLAKEDEVSYDDMKHARGRDKAGWWKVDFCRRQTLEDGLQYFWIDSCCIDKTNSVELAEALHSMFTWYANAKACYAYLVDVPAGHDWESSFKNARWFTRGWTLQELIAPPDVEFFARTGEKVGSRNSLKAFISEITKIPTAALQGGEPQEFSLLERQQWQLGRQTTKAEDLVYSLFGLLGVRISLMYGEGEASARTRLQRELRGVTSRSQDFSLSLSLTRVKETTNLVGREKELRSMRTSLSSAGGRRYVVLSGLGGVGKTQLALAYALRHRDDYSAIIWLDASSEDTLDLSYADALRHLQTERPEDSALRIQTNQSRIVERWLNAEGNTRWLVICDNYDDPSAFDLKSRLPQRYQGAVIITTRSVSVRLGDVPFLRVAKLLDYDDALAVLTSTSARHNLAEDPNIGKLIKKLDGLPLALATAGGYLRQTAVDCATYIRGWDSLWSALQQHSPELETYDKTLYSTWQITFDRVLSESTDAANMLRLWAYLDHRDLWYELLHHDKIFLPWLARVTKDSFTFHEVMSVLCKHGLVQVESNDSGSISSRCESGGYSIHTCVHAWTKGVLNTSWNADLAIAALCCVAAHVPGEHVKNWSIIQQRVLNHANCFTALRSELITDVMAQEAYHSIGALLIDVGKYSEAAAVLSQVLENKQSIQGIDHVSIIDTVSKLGHVRSRQDRLEEAQILYEKVYQWLTEHQDFDQKRYLKSMLHVANAYASQQNYIAAEFMYVRAIESQREVLGELDALTLDTVSNLATVYSTLNYHQKATELWEHVIPRYIRIFGDDHTSVHFAQHNLAVSYGRQMKNREAEALSRLVLAGRERLNGRDHPVTLDTASHLGQILLRLGHEEEAESLLMRAYQNCIDIYGLDHTAVDYACRNLGLLYFRQRRLDEAEAMCRPLLVRTDKVVRLEGMATLANIFRWQDKLQDAIDMWQAWLEENDEPASDDTLFQYTNLAKAYSALGDTTTAEHFHRLCIIGRVALYGLDAEKVTDAMDDLAHTLAKTTPEEALDLYLQVYERRAATLGEDDAMTMLAAYCAGDLYIQQEDWIRAESLLKVAFDAQMRSGGHDNMLNSMASLLGMAYESQGKYAEAISTLETSLRRHRIIHGEVSVDCFHVQHQLGGVHKRLRNWPLAQSMYEQSLMGKERTLPADDHFILATVEQLSLVHLEKGELDTAERYANRMLIGLRDRQYSLTSEISAMQVLGDVYRRRDDLEKAREMYKHCGDQQDFIHDSKDVAFVLEPGSKLAEVYKLLNRMDDARMTFERMLQSCTRLCGEEDVRTLSIINNLAYLLYSELNDYDGAMQLFIPALSTASRLLGDEHQLTLRLLVNLALIHARQGRIAESTSLFQRASPFFTPSNRDLTEVREVMQLLARAIMPVNDHLQWLLT